MPWLAKLSTMSRRALWRLTRSPVREQQVAWSPVISIFFCMQTGQSISSLRRGTPSRYCTAVRNKCGRILAPLSSSLEGTAVTKLLA